MYNLIMSGAGWSERRDTFPASRVFEYTEKSVLDQLQPGRHPNFDALVRLPAVFAEEKNFNDLSQVVRVGTISRVRVSGRDLVLDYSFDATIPAFSNKELLAWAIDLDIDSSELTRTHWAVKDVDLFEVLLREFQPRRLRPRVFELSDPEQIESTLVSAMMPFHPSFDPVYKTFQEVATASGARCRRADDIWENPAVMHDVVSLIDRSSIVVCDCSCRNPNVFYEIGIAHTLGREVILITQSESDIPFDLRHLRYLSYLNNGEGLADLKERLTKRIADLMGA